MQHFSRIRFLVNIALAGNVKKGLMHIVKGKSASRAVELILLSACVMYGKDVNHCYSKACTENKPALQLQELEVHNIR